MNDHEHREFLTDLLEITAELRQIVIDYCRLITAEDDGHSWEGKAEWPEVPF